MIKRVLLMPFRFMLHPWAYFDVLISMMLQTSVIMRMYHRLIVPLIVRRIRRKGSADVVFVAMYPDMWRYDGVFKRLQADERFHPYVVVGVRKGSLKVLGSADQEASIEFFSKRGYKVVPGYDAQRMSWRKLKTLKPDIVFYTQPYDGSTGDSLEFRTNWRSLFCYAPYSFQMSKSQWNWNNPLQNYCWRHYLMGRYQSDVCREFSIIKAENAAMVGYCLEEELVCDANHKSESDVAWHHDRRRRVIWAPHHSILEIEMFKVSAFLEIAELMVALRKEYEDRIVFAFKPHPVLKPKLYKIWGQERTDAYYRGWAEADNSFDAQGSYQSLFSGSDAMIHCSGSFIVEYLYTNKPVQYVYARTRTPPDLGEIGDAALGAHYPAHSALDIRKFLDEVVLGGKDTMKQSREEVAAKYLKSPNGKMFSENVYNDLVKSLGWS